MGYEIKKINEAFNSNEIKKILLIDDAYDPPGLDDDIVGSLYDFLNEEDGWAVCDECGIDRNTLELATNAADEGDTESPELKAVYRVLFKKFAQTGDRRFDPSEQFRLFKEDALAVLRPIEALLRKSGDTVQVETIGFENAMDCYREFHPQVLFLDYYLSDDVPGVGKVSGYRMSKARKASMVLLKEMVKANNSEEIPAIVLMSSRKVQNVDQYRHDAGGQQILSLRFNFLQKKLVRYEGEEIVVESDAADALLDTSQGYLFGKLIQQALAQWKEGTKKALEDFMTEVRDLQLKDFAYLLRFRLRDEGQPFSEYLEWFLGESLKGLIEERVDWAHASFASLADNDKPERLIEGAFDGPSNIIAKLFHRVRVNTSRNRNNGDNRLGDLYFHREDSSVRAIITPDCDLVNRKGGPKAKGILTMVGTLETFDKKNSSADDFLIRENSPYSVRWDTKNLETFPINGEESLNGTDTMELLGTFRPLYAQDIQHRVINDLSRLGLPIAPAFGVNVPATFWIRLPDSFDKDFEQIEMKTSLFVTIIPRRSGDQGGPRVLMRRRLLNELINGLRKINDCDIENQHRKQLRDVLKANSIEELYKRYLYTGLHIEKTVQGTGFVVGTGPKREDSKWLQIVLKISDNAMETIGTMDPVLDNP